MPCVGSEGKGQIKRGSYREKDFSPGQEGLCQRRRERATVEAGSFSLLHAFKEALWLTDLAGSPSR